MVNKIDRVFLGVAFNSEDMKLVSHDYQDFQIPKRNHINDQLGIDVINAEEGINCL